MKLLSNLLLVLILQAFTTYAGPLHDAVQDGTFDNIERILDRDTSEINTADTNGLTPLMLALNRPYFSPFKDDAEQVIRALLRKGESILTRVNGRTIFPALSARITTTKPGEFPGADKYIQNAKDALALLRKLSIEYGQKLFDIELKILERHGLGSPEQYNMEFEARRRS